MCDEAARNVRCARQCARQCRVYPTCCLWWPGTLHRLPLSLHVVTLTWVSMQVCADGSVGHCNILNASHMRLSEPLGHSTPSVCRASPPQLEALLHQPPTTRQHLFPRCSAPDCHCQPPLSPVDAQRSSLAPDIAHWHARSQEPSLHGMPDDMTVPQPLTTARFGSKRVPRWVKRKNILAERGDASADAGDHPQCIDADDLTQIPHGFVAWHGWLRGKSPDSMSCVALQL